jgi:hypothetical protein
VSRICEDLGPQPRACGGEQLGTIIAATTFFGFSAKRDLRAGNGGAGFTTGTALPSPSLSAIATPLAVAGDVGLLAAGVGRLSRE